MNRLAPSGSQRSAPHRREAYDRAIELLARCATPYGFVASTTEQDNYHRIWARDGMIVGLAALQCGEPELLGAFRRTLEYLAEHRSRHGQIPSNVDPDIGRVSYGGTVGRVDSSLWFVIGCVEYWRVTGDDAFLECMHSALEGVRFVLGAWEFNERGLLYVPKSGDWADEYIQSGYVLYDQLLYLQAQRALAEALTHLNGVPPAELCHRVAHLERTIQANYWLCDDEQPPCDAYHDVLYRKGRRAMTHVRGCYWMPFFDAHGYGYRFDAFANVLASLLGVANAVQRRRVDAYIRGRLANPTGLLPAFHPVITPLDADWEDLLVSFCYTFKNQPHEYHNGGLWPMITGFYAADLAARSETDGAEYYLDAINRANALAMDGQPWSFPEYVHGRTYRASGTRHQAWSAAATVMATCALEGCNVFEQRGMRCDFTYRRGAPAPADVTTLPRGVKHAKVSAVVVGNRSLRRGASGS